MTEKTLNFLNFKKQSKVFKILTVSVLFFIVSMLSTSKLVHSYYHIITPTNCQHHQKAEHNIHKNHYHNSSDVLKFTNTEENNLRLINSCFLCQNYTDLTLINTKKNIFCTPFKVIENTNYNPLRSQSYTFHYGARAPPIS